MTTLPIEAQVSTEQVIHSVARLPPQEFASFVARLLDTHARNWMPVVEQGKTRCGEDEDVTISSLAAQVRASRQRRLGLTLGGITTTTDFDAPLPDEFWLGDA